MIDRDAADQPGPGIGRVEAFSDGVIAIIITIMVLELRPPEGGLDRLWLLWPTFLAYLLSYVYVGIYWVNHHQLLHHARRVTNALVWSNLLLLFALSLVPFATAYLGEHRFDRPSTAVYLSILLLPVIGYVWLQTVIRRTGAQNGDAQRYHQATVRKGIACAIIYLIGLALTSVSGWAGIAAAVLVAMLWILPQSRIDGWFAR